MWIPSWKPFIWKMLDSGSRSQVVAKLTLQKNNWNYDWSYWTVVKNQAKQAPVQQFVFVDLAN